MTEVKWFEEQAAGLSLLKTWTDDISRTGWSGVNPGQLEEIASRLVDLRLGGLARNLRQLAAYDWSDEQHFKQIAASIADMRMASAMHAASASAALPLQESLQAYLSGTQRKPDPGKETLFKDHWIVLKVRLDKEEGLRSRKIWLQGIKSLRYAYILDFVFGTAQFEGFYRAGDCLDAELCYYPAVWPYRAIWSNPLRSQGQLHPGRNKQTLEDFLNRYSAVIAYFPMLLPVPLQLDGGSVQYLHDRFWYVDSVKGGACKMQVTDSQGWKLVAASLGAPIPLFGEWYRGEFIPLALTGIASGFDF